MNKRIIGIIISLTIIFQISYLANTPVFAQDSQEKILLQKLGIMNCDDESFAQGQGIVTRASFVAILANLLDVKSDTQIEKQIFKDVEKNYWAAGYISKLYQMGVILPVNENSFMPEAPLDIETLSKGLIFVLGFSEEVGKGSNYTVKAQQEGLFKSVSLGKNITYSNLITIIYNALFANKLNPVSFGEQIKYTKKAGGLLLDRYNVEEKNGKVEANAITQLSGANSVLKGEVLISGVVYRVGDTSIENLIGRSIQFFVTETEDEKPLIISAIEKTNNTLCIDTSDILELTSKPSQYSITYSYKNSNKTVQIPSNADVIYNGKLYNGYTLSDFKPNMGTINLLDDNNDNLFEIVFINEYENFIVEKVDMSKGYIYEKYGQGFEIDFRLINDKLFLYDLQGKTLSAQSVKEGSILSKYTSKDDEITRIYVSNSSKKVDIGELTKDDKAYVKVGASTYEISSDYLGYCEQDVLPNNVDVIAVGDSGVIYIDVFGKIAGFKRDSFATMKFGYIIDAKKSTKPEENFEIKLFTQNGAFEIYTVAKNVVIDGEPILSESNILPKLDFKGDITKSKRRLILFHLNSTSEIKMIDTISQTEYENQNAFNWLGNCENRWFKAGIYDGRFAFGSNPVVFGVPELASVDDEKDYRIIDIESVSAEGKYSFDAYGDPIYYLMNAMVVSGYLGITDDSDILVVDKITQTVDDDGMIVAGIHGFQSGKAFFARVNSKITSLVNNLNQGDILRISLDDKGYIINMKQAFYQKDNATDTELAVGPSISYNKPILTSPNMFSSYYVSYGKAYSRSGNNLNINIDNVNRAMIDLSPVKLIIVDKKNNKIFVGTSSDILDLISVGESNASKIFIHINSGLVKSVVVYND